MVFYKLFIFRSNVIPNTEVDIDSVVDNKLIFRKAVLKNGVQIKNSLKILMKKFNQMKHELDDLASHWRVYEDN